MEKELMKKVILKFLTSAGKDYHGKTRCLFFLTILLICSIQAHMFYYLSRNGSFYSPFLILAYLSGLIALGFFVRRETEKTKAM